MWNNRRQKRAQKALHDFDLRIAIFSPTTKFAAATPAADLGGTTLFLKYKLKCGIAGNEEAVTERLKKQKSMSNHHKLHRQDVLRARNILQSTTVLPSCN